MDMSIATRFRLINASIDVYSTHYDSGVVWAGFPITEEWVTTGYK
jgi:hypothetical protein